MQPVSIKDFNDAYIGRLDQGEGMANKDLVFTVYGVANGFYAETARGNILVGATLSDVCTAAQAKVAEEKLSRNESDAGYADIDARKLVPKKAWQPILKT